MNRAGAAHASFNFFPAFSIPGAAMQFRWNFYEYSRGKLRLLLLGVKRKTPPVTSGCKVNANRLYTRNETRTIISLNKSTVGVCFVALV